MNNKYWLMSIFSAAVLVLGACGNDEESSEGTSDEDTEITVVAQTPPMTDVVEIVGEVIEEPYTVELVEVADNIQYNQAVSNDEADASFAQHEPFMEQFNTENDADLWRWEEFMIRMLGFTHPVTSWLNDWKDAAEFVFQMMPTNQPRP